MNREKMFPVRVPVIVYNLVAIRLWFPGISTFNKTSSLKGFITISFPYYING